MPRKSDPPLFGGVADQSTAGDVGYGARVLSKASSEVSVVKNSNTDRGKAIHILEWKSMPGIKLAISSESTLDLKKVSGRKWNPAEKTTVEY